MLVLAACAAHAPRPAPVRPAPPPPPPAVPEKLFPAEVVHWENGRETVLARTRTLDPATWPSQDSGIWFVRPIATDLSADELAAFVARAVALRAPGISVAGEEAADDTTVAPVLAARDVLTFFDASGTRITDQTALALATFPRLEHLWLTSTAITDASLVAIAKMPAVKSLRVDGTAISDTGFAELARLSTLLVLTAGTTNVSDAAIQQVVAAVPLVYLALPHTSVTGAGLEPLTSRCTLIGLDLGDTRIDNAAIQRVLHACRGLSELDLARTPITDTAGLLRGLPLHRLDLMATRVTTVVLDDIADALDLMWLDLSDTKVVAGKASQLARLRALEHLGLGRLGVQREAIDWIALNPSLRELDLSRASIGDDDVRRLASFAFTRLLLGGTRIGDATIAALHLEDLRVLDVENTPVTRASIERIAQLTGLEELYLSRTHIDGSFDRLAVLHRLRVLHLEDLRVTDAALALLDTLPHLEELSLSGTDITGKALIPRLRPLLHLRSLGLDRITLTDADARALVTAAPALDTLSVAQDDLSDDTIGALAELPHLAQLSVAFDDATDVACAKLAAVPHLVAINLSHSTITTHCLDAWTHAPNLRELYAEDIAVKRLDAHLYAAIAKLPRLQTLDLDRGLLRPAWRRALAARGVTVIEP